jgi:alkylation response protein AidB-like acyl-CoA dehydrogenase
MSEYRPPLQDMRFVLEHVADLSGLVELDAFSHVDVDVAHGALDEAARFFTEVVLPTNRTGDLEGCVRHDDGSVTTPKGFREAYEQFVAAGWGAVSAPMEHGGHGFPKVIGLAIQEMLTATNMALSLCPMLTASAIEALHVHGTDDIKATYLEKLVSGEWTGTMHLTESEAGSDVGALRARAEPREDGSWALTGTKIFISWGEHDVAENIIHLVLARTPGAPPGTKGISLFLVPKFLVRPDGSLGERNAIVCESIEHKVGIHGSPTCVMSLDQAVGFMIGEEFDGMRTMFTMMNDARLNVGLEGLALADHAYQRSIQWATERKQGRAVGAPKTESSPIIEHPDVQRMLLTIRANVEAMRALMYENAAAIDRSTTAAEAPEREEAANLAALLTPVSKGWGTDLGVEMTSLAVQIHGGMGYVEETGIAQLWRDARIAPIYEGTNGIQAIDLVLRKLPLAGGATVRRYINDMRTEAERLPEDQATRLLAAIEGLSEATEHLIAADDPSDVLAGATPYLRMFGIVAGGYYHARMMRAARAGMGNADGFNAAKVRTGEFYIDQIVPTAMGLLPSILAPAKALAGLEADIPA